MFARKQLILLSLLLISAYGLTQDSVIPFKDNWLFFRGKTQPPLTWSGIDFDDSNWETGRAPLGYGSGESAYLNTIISDMQNSYWSLYCRRKFTVEDIFPLTGIQFQAYYDDGFVAYLNGQRIAYRGLTTPNPPYNAPATSHEADPALEPEPISISTTALQYLKNGENVLALQVHNTALDSSDLFIDVQFSLLSETPPFACMSNFTGVDEGDSIVTFSWTLPVDDYLERIEIREDDTVIAEATGEETGIQVSGIEAGDHVFRIFGLKDGQAGTCYGGFVELTVSPVKYFVRGDMNDDGAINLVDPISLIEYLFQDAEQPACMDACDVDDNGVLNLADVIGVLDYLYNSGTAPSAPGPETCGIDETLDDLPICIFDQCEGQTNP